MPTFDREKIYSLEEIKAAFEGRGGNQLPVIVKHKSEVLYIKFRADENPCWQKGELWIQAGDKRIPDANAWITAKSSVPIFCKENKDGWKYMGDATAEELMCKSTAQKYTKDERVVLVLKLNYKTPNLADLPASLRRKFGSAA